MPKVSNPIATPGPMTEKEMETYVKDILVPIVDKFVKSHKGKEYTASDVEDLYKNLNNSLSKDPRILDKWSGGIDQNAVRKEMAADTAKEINKLGKLSGGDKLIQGFGNFCKKIGLGKIGDACLKHAKTVNLTKEIGKIASKVASTKISIEVGGSNSAKIAKPIKKDSRTR